MMECAKVPQKKGRAHSVFVFLMLSPRHPTEGLHRLCHQRQAADEVHAREQAVLPVQDVEICGVAPVRVRHHDSYRPQHGGADDEGQLLLLPPPPLVKAGTKQSGLLAQRLSAAMRKPVQIFRRIAKVMTVDVFAARMQAGTVGWPGRYSGTTGNHDPIRPWHVFCFASSEEGATPRRDSSTQFAERELRFVCQSLLCVFGIYLFF